MVNRPERLIVRRAGEPSTINLTRRIEFHLLYPWHIT
jgi:hypothetical protein